MRRRITLYIGGTRADLADDGLVLLNVALTDLTNPAVIRNSWTQSVELPRSPRNDQIFGHSGRLDRLAGAGGSGPDFNASRRTSFSIYAETGKVLFSGYAKLEAVTRDAYTVQLFGGLGDFLYCLTYDAAGNKRSLADLDFGVDLDFTINAQTVAEAWARLLGDTSKPEKWDVINFAPAYNGIPADFSADKAIARPGDVSLDVPSGYATKDGYTLITLAGQRDEWEAMDLRSYLQRPVVSMRRLLQAIADPANNGGWTVDLSDVTIGYQDTWLTRPLLPSLGTYKQTEGSVTTTFQQYASGKVIGRYTLTGAPAGSELTARLSTGLAYTVPGASASTLRSWARSSGQSFVPDGYWQQVLFVQAVAYGSDDTMVAAGPVRTICKSADVIAPATLATALGYTPEGGAAFASAEQDHSFTLDGGRYVRQRDITTEVTGQNIARIDIVVTAYVALITDAGAVFSATGGTSSLGQLYTFEGASYTPTAAAAPSGSGTNSYASTENLRSGARITKAMLLSTSNTPADYLTAFCKAFGLMIVADGETKTVRILRRESFYQDETIDITAHVDKPSVKIRPLTFDAKWYELRHESVGGRFENEYEKTSGVQYGIQRIDTGYDFDAQTKDLLSGSVLKSCAAVQARSKYFYTITAPGNKETLTETGSSENVILADGSLTTAPAYVMKSYDITNAQQIFITGRQGIIPTYAIARFLDSGGSVISVVQLADRTDYTDQEVPIAPGATRIDVCGNGAVGCSAIFPRTMPGVFLDTGCTYILWNGDGDSENFDIVLPGNITADPLNATWPGYDLAHRAEFRDAENKPVDGADVLLFQTGSVSSVFYALTDDLPAMDTLNGGPCWLLGANGSSLQIPTFSRYRTIAPIGGGNPSVVSSLDFGIPRELDIPGLEYSAGTIYLTRWQKYVRDRLSVHGKVLRARVNLDGLQVGPDLLRRFYWYRGSLWALVSVSNYSLTTFDPAECEFIQVRDITNYTD